MPSYFLLLGHVRWIYLGVLLCFLNGNRREVDLRERGGGGRKWEEWRGLKLLHEWNVGEKNKSLKNESKEFIMLSEWNEKA